jgi:hypothetical protein
VRGRLSPVVLPVALAGMAACASPRPFRPVPGSPVQPARECQSVEQLLAPADPEPMAARRLKRVHACPALAGRALARALLDLRGSRDTVRLREVTDLTQYVHDAGLLDAALSVARDGSASVEARVFAFRTLTWTFAPGHGITYEAMLREPPQRPSMSSYTGHYYHGYTAGDLAWPAFGEMPAPDFVERIRDACRRTAADPAQPDPVRRAARTTCAWEPDRELLAKRSTHGG